MLVQSGIDGPVSSQSRPEASRLVTKVLWRVAKHRSRLVCSNFRAASIASVQKMRMEENHFNQGLMRLSK